MIISMPTNSIAQLRLWQLISPALPIGAFAYSQGFEYAVECDWVTDEEQAYQWISGIAEHSVASLDLPVMVRCYHAWRKNDSEAIEKWSQFLLASRESKEMLAEDQNIGKALATLLTELEVSQAAEWCFSSQCSFVVMFSLLDADAIFGY